MSTIKSFSIDDLLSLKLDYLFIGLGATGLAIVARWILDFLRPGKKSQVVLPALPDVDSFRAPPSQLPLRPEQYDIRPETGFLPERPLPPLPGQFAIWERTLAGAQQVLVSKDDHSAEGLAKRPAGEKWRAAVRSWPILNIDDLGDNLRYWQKAHKVLSFTLHFYAHSVPMSSKDEPIHIPPSLAVPLVAVSRKLGMAPVLTFADFTYWNYELIDPNGPVVEENLSYVTLLSGTRSEDSLYKLSAVVDLKGIEILKAAERFVNMGDVIEEKALAILHRDLTQLKTTADELTTTFARIRDTADPYEYYWYVRSWWGGAGKLPNGKPGWIFEGVPNSESLDLFGASASQSSAMRALDILLDVDHKLSQSRQPAPSEANKKVDVEFLEKMTKYVPGLHREYLHRLAATPRTLRQVAEANPSLLEPYNAIIAALKQCRSVHLQIATLFIISQARSQPPEGREVKQATDQVKIATSHHEGSNLLKASRDATNRAVIHETKL